MAMVRSEVRHDGGHLRLVLDRPKGNIVSLEMMQALLEALEGAGAHGEVRLDVLGRQPERGGGRRGRRGRRRRRRRGEGAEDA
jgi:enoyl-CoA hydratase/carnithine racemase